MTDVTKIDVQHSILSVLVYTRIYLRVNKNLWQWVNIRFIFMKGTLLTFIIYFYSVLAGPNVYSMTLCPYPADDSRMFVVFKSVASKFKKSKSLWHVWCPGYRHSVGVPWSGHWPWASCHSTTENRFTSLPSPSWSRSWVDVTISHVWILTHFMHIETRFMLQFLSYLKGGRSSCHILAASFGQVKLIKLHEGCQARVRHWIATLRWDWQWKILGTTLGTTFASSLPWLREDVWQPKWMRCANFYPRWLLCDSILARSERFAPQMILFPVLWKPFNIF